jgi:hypothetical protein
MIGIGRAALRLAMRVNIAISHGLFPGGMRQPVAYCRW